MDMEKELGMINQEREIEREKRDRGHIHNMIYNNVQYMCKTVSGWFPFASVRSPSMVIRICVESTKFSFSIIKFIYFDTVFTKKKNLILESMMNRLK